MEITAIIRNRNEGYNPPNSVDVSTIDFAAVASAFLVPLFTPMNRWIATQEAHGRGMKPHGLLSDRNNDLPAVFTHGEGCFINKRVVIGAHSAIGNHVVINRGAAVGHHLKTEDFVSIGPGVVTGGEVTIKRGALIGTGAVILPTVTIGKHATVGAGAVVTKDVEDYAVVVGNPARVVKANSHDF
jgi:sugar O-acyltransferase (sialic acid O-acetyltransferase NeuD family)